MQNIFSRKKDTLVLDYCSHSLRLIFVKKYFNFCVHRKQKGLIEQ